MGLSAAHWGPCPVRGSPKAQRERRGAEESTGPCPTRQPRCAHCLGCADNQPVANLLRATWTFPLGSGLQGLRGQSAVDRPGEGQARATCVLLESLVGWISLSPLSFSNKAQNPLHGSRNTPRNQRQKLQESWRPILWNFRSLTSGTFCCSKPITRPFLMGSDIDPTSSRALCEKCGLS